MWLLLIALLAQPPDYQADGLKAMSAGKFSDAAELFTKAVAADPKDYTAHFNLAFALGALRKEREAIPHYKEALALKPDLYQAQLNVGICLLRVKDPAGALPYLKAATAQHPDEFRPMVYYAESLLETGKFADATELFTRAVSLSPTSAQAESGLAQSLAKQDRLTDADPHYRKAATLDPVYRDLLLELAEMYEKKKQAPEAIALYHEFPNSPAAQERMGMLLNDTGQFDKAISPLEMAVALSPSVANQMALAQAYLGNKQPDKAIPFAELALNTEPNNYDLRMFYGRLLRDQRKFTQAAPQFLAATKLKPDAPQSWNELASSLILADQYPEAIAALDKVRTLGAETPAHFYLRGLSYDHLHQAKEALANYNRFLELSQGKSPDEEFKARQRARILQNELNKK